MEDKKQERKYPYTKQLVRIALDQGYKPEDILIKAGLSPNSKSQFSKWRNGKSQAKHRQLRYFINEYEHLLKRKLEHLFYYKEDDRLSFRKVNGEVVLKHTIRHPPLSIRKRVVAVALFRIVLLKEGNYFNLVLQARVGLEAEKRFYPGNDIEKLLHSPNEEANWFAYKFAIQLSADDTLKAVEVFIHEIETGESLAGVRLEREAVALAYIVRQALMKHGYTSPDILD